MASVNKNVVNSFYALALARISLGIIFLWAFLDKMFGLGFSTCRVGTTNVVNMGCSQAWAQGGSPTASYLQHASGPFASFYQSLAGHSWVDYLFMSGLLMFGIGLILGIGMRLLTTLAAMLLLMMWSSALWPASNPLLDEHIVYIFVLIALNLGNSQQKWGLRDWWIKTKLVKNIPLFE